MRYVVDHDFHIHSQHSPCSCDPDQNPVNMLLYARSCKLSTIILTDHFWDDTIPLVPQSHFYSTQTYAKISQNLPLPKCDNVRFLFGCEADMNMYKTLGITRETIDKFDFVNVALTHLHRTMNGFTVRGDEGPEERAEIYKDRINTFLDMDLPFRKMGIAHITAPHTFPQRSTEVFDLVSDEDYRKMFRKAADRGVGIELNFSTTGYGDKLPSVLRPYLIAKEEGCKFFFGSDAHHVRSMFYFPDNANKIVDLLSLEESDKFILETDAE